MIPCNCGVCAECDWARNHPSDTVHNEVHIDLGQFILKAGVGELLTHHARLPAARKTEVLPLSYAAVSHGMAIDVNGNIVVMIPAPGVFMGRSLLVSYCIVEDGELVTPVFNLSNERVVVMKDEVLSYIVALRKA